MVNLHPRVFAHLALANQEQSMIGAIAALFWLISALVPIPWRFGFWTLGIIIDFATPLTGRKFQIGLLPHASHLP